ncbi:hypothetical protein GTP91_00375 [Rugamonas sp. FT82W]|uniref:Uncharacterized protein n=1 Tax=Duganella vulcania TaxID=2692166 RepID=A0A845FXU7_9BURK|nr:hypothetical protein [Duganella vulcania]MYM85627.1 hypothetical protein [Duganella vulcania]
MSKIRTFLSGATTMAAALAAVFALTAAKTQKKETFDEITVGRINIVEPDGTKRIIISNKAQFPGDFQQGKEGARPDRRDFAGMLFINEEGTENGGLIQKGSMTADGKISAGLSLTFDRFRQDQTLQLLSDESDAYQATSIKINDVPSFKITSMEDMTRFGAEADKLPAADQRAYWKKLSEEGRLSENRVWLGNIRDKGSMLQLKDAKGRPRLVLRVAADGKAQIQMLDEQGKVLKSIDPAN